MMRGRRIALAAAALAALGIAAAVWADALLPPDLTRAEDRSVVVADAQHEILRVFTTGDGKWRLPVRAEQVDQRYLALLRAYEDRRFAHHWGVEPLALLRAAGQWLAAGHIVSGGSTLTMQAARLLEPRPRGIRAKLRQIARALQLEERYDKGEVLSLYLTLAPFGGNLEGVRAATLAYFGKEPTHLTLGEAALLVALPQSPERLRPDRHPEAAARGRDKVLQRLVAAGAISAAEAREAAAETLPKTRLAFPFHAPHLAQRLAAAAKPGSAIDTTIDGALQQRVEALAQSVRRWFADGANLAIIVVDNRSGAVRAYLGGADFFAPAGEIDLARARRSPGSALKPFIYGMAFDDGILHPASLIDDAPTRFGDYAPRDFDRAYLGTVSAREALQLSLNVPAVAVLDRVGAVRFIANLRQAGAALRFQRLAGAPSLQVALGGLGISLSDLTMLYAGIAAGGRVRPLAVTAGEAGEPRRVMSATAAWYVTDILAGSPPPEGWAPGDGVTRPHRIAFKTGTSYGFRDAWAVGYSGDYTVGVWVGRADGSPRPGHYGRNTAAPVMLKVFALLPAEAPRYDPAPPDALLADSSAALPPALRHFAREPLAPALAHADAPPQILFPPDGAEIDWRPGRGDSSGIALKAAGGKAPLLWLVDGRPLATSPLAADNFWCPTGEGFARIAVIDAEGRSAAVRIRVKAER
jgi:penicillin-binding protein 1C